METVFGMSIYTILALVFWTLPWKAWALWRAARRGDIWWFLIMVVVSTLGLLEMFYIFAIAKQRDTRDVHAHNTRE